MKYQKYLIIAILALISAQISAQQVADTNFNPVILKPEYTPGKGPVVAIDEGHNNISLLPGCSDLMGTKWIAIKEILQDHN
jgi:hypothetical protein